MSKTIIQVHNLSKRYRIGLKEKRHDTFAQQLLATLKAPITNFRQLRSLSKFGAEDESVFWALKDINFEVKEGEVLGIIGHNGAGKSTLLKILSRITEPTTGEIRLKGRVSALLEVGTGFHPELTGRENVYMNGTILGMTKREIDTKFDEIVDFSGVEKYIDTPVKFYSSGMKVRLGFAVAAHLEPEILIIDEVLAVGDAEFQKKCLGKMHDVAENEGRTVLFVSHNMAAVSNLCNKALFVYNGGINFNGETDLAINYYLGNSLLDKVIFEENSQSAQILSFEVVSQKINRTYAIEEVLELKVSYKLRKHGLRLSLSIAVFDKEGNYVFNSPSISDSNLSGKEHSIGDYEAIIKIPSNIFNVGIYHFTIMLIEDYRIVKEIKENIISIETGISKPEEHIHYFGKWNGIVRPKILWNIQKKY